MTRGTVVTPIVSDVEYKPFGPVKQVTFGNGQGQTRTYDLEGRPATYSLPSQNLALTYNEAGDITKIGDPAVTASVNNYVYDALSRLERMYSSTSNYMYQYDAVGNRTQRTLMWTPTDNLYGGAGNRLTRVGAQPITTDANGSITDRGNAVLSYDARGRMVSANTPIGVVTYTINSLGQRVRKATPTETTVFHYDLAGKLIAESTTAGATTTAREYVYLGDMPVAVLK